MKKLFIALEVLLIAGFIVGGIIINIKVDTAAAFTGFIGAIVCGIAGMVFSIVGFQLEYDARFETLTRLFTHSALFFTCGIVFIILGALTNISAGLMTGIICGSYFVLYYVFGIVQIPLNLYYGKLNYKKFYSPFYPFLSKKMREMLLLGSKVQTKDKFSYERNGLGCKVKEEFFFIQGRQYGKVTLCDKYLLTEFSSNAWSEKTFDRLSARLGSCGFRAVGYRTERTESVNAVKLLTVPDTEHYKKGLSVIASFFKRNGIQYENSVVSYEDFSVEVLPQLTPYPVNAQLLKVSVDEPFDGERINFYGRVLAFFERARLKAAGGVGSTIFYTAFGVGASFSQKETFVKECERNGFLCIEISAIKGVLLRKVINYNGNELTEALNSLYEAAKAHGGLQISWEIDV